MDRRVTSPTRGSLKQALICYYIPMLLFDLCNYCIECILLRVNKQLKPQHFLWSPTCLVNASPRTADVFPVVALPPREGREATTGNTSAVRRLRKCQAHVKWPLLSWSCFSPQTPNIGGPGLANCGLSDDERLLVQRFDPSKLDGEISAHNRDTIGFFIAKFVKMSSWINTDV